MIIFIGGLPGSGRAKLARELSRRLKFHHYDTDRLKMKRFLFDKRRVVSQVALSPKDDESRMRIYEKMANDFHMLSRLYEGVVVDGAFHKVRSRDYLLSQARMYFDKVVFIWVEGDEQDASDRIEQMQKKGMNRRVKKLQHHRKSARKNFEPFAAQPPTFFYARSNKNSADEFCKFVDECMKAM